MEGVAYRVPSSHKHNSRTFIPQSVEGPLWRGRQSMVAQHTGHHPTSKGLFACEVSCALFPFFHGWWSRNRTSDELFLSCGLAPTRLHAFFGTVRCSQAFRFYFSPHTWPSPLHVHEWVLTTANTEVLKMVSLGIVRLHRAIASSVLKWHEMNPMGSLTMQRLYPLAHFTLRVAEV